MKKTTKRILSLVMCLAMLLPFTLQIVPVAAADTGATNAMTLQGERIYQIMTDRFYDGDPTNNAQGEALRYQEITAEDMRYMKGGDWQGIIEKIPYIRRCLKIGNMPSGEGFFRQTKPI